MHPIDVLDDDNHGAEMLAKVLAGLLIVMGGVAIVVMVLCF